LLKNEQNRKKDAADREAINVFWQQCLEKEPFFAAARAAAAVPDVRQES
jgi:hypothetical protein